MLHIRVHMCYTDSVMAFELDQLNDNTSNIYELSSAMSRRAYQLALAGDDDASSEGDKPVVAAIRQLLDKSVQYQIDSTPDR